jgi:hypothetical protein
MMAFGYLVVCPFEAVSVGAIAAQLVPGLKQLPLYQVGESTVYLPGLLVSVRSGGVFAHWLD